MAYEMSKYYTCAEELARRLQEWSNCLDLPEDKKFYIMTGGGPGIMEAANKGAYRAGGTPVGATIVIPDEQKRNKYLDRGVWINFNYFLMRNSGCCSLRRRLLYSPAEQARSTNFSRYSH